MPSPILPTLHYPTQASSCPILPSLPPIYLPLPSFKLSCLALYSTLSKFTLAGLPSLTSTCLTLLYLNQLQPPCPAFPKSTSNFTQQLSSLDQPYLILLYPTPTLPCPALTYASLSYPSKIPRPAPSITKTQGRKTCVVRNVLIVGW